MNTREKLFCPKISISHIEGNTLRINHLAMDDANHCFVQVNMEWRVNKLIPRIHIKKTKVQSV